MTANLDTRPAEVFIRAERESYETMMRGEPFFSEVVAIGPREVPELRGTIRVRETAGGIYTGRWAVVSLSATWARLDGDIDTATVVYRVATSKLSGRMQMLPGAKKNPGLEILAYSHTGNSYRMGKIGGDDAREERNRVETVSSVRGGNPSETRG